MPSPAAASTQAVQELTQRLRYTQRRLALALMAKALRRLEVLGMRYYFTAWRREAGTAKLSAHEDDAPDLAAAKELLARLQQLRLFSQSSSPR